MGFILIIALGFQVEKESSGCLTRRLSRGRLFKFCCERVAHLVFPGS
jgi:hypothetical protein